MKEPDENLQMRCIAKLRALEQQVLKKTGEELDQFAERVLDLEQYDHGEPEK